jgi:Spy/CpxP family protein refolding chaperone
MDVSVTAAVMLAMVAMSTVLVALAADLARVRRPLRYWLTM